MKITLTTRETKREGTTLLANGYVVSRCFLNARCAMDWGKQHMPAIRRSLKNRTTK